MISIACVIMSNPSPPPPSPGAQRDSVETPGEHAGMDTQTDLDNAMPPRVQRPEIDVAFVDTVGPKHLAKKRQKKGQDSTKRVRAQQTKARIDHKHASDRGTGDVK